MVGSDLARELFLSKLRASRSSGRVRFWRLRRFLLELTGQIDIRNPAGEHRWIGSAEIAEAHKGKALIGKPDKVGAVAGVGAPVPNGIQTFVLANRKTKRVG